MRTLYLAVFLTSCLLILPVFGFIDAYGHGIPSGVQPRYLRIDQEQFSDNTVTTDDVVVITGEIKGIVNRPVTLAPYVYVDHDAVPPYGNLLALIYPPLKDQSAWYFRVEDNLSNPVILSPGEKINYEIKLYPLKAGSYHVHTYLFADYGTSLARGQTVIVTGQTMPAAGEVTHLYLPLAFGAVAIAALTFATIKRTRGHRAREKAVRAYFVIKSSFETIWLAGIAFWLTSATYLYPFEARYAMLAGVTAALAAVTAGGYIAVIAKSRTRQRLFAVATPATTVALYVALQYAGGYDSIGNLFKPFNPGSLVLLITIIANAVAAILISILAIKERNEPAQIMR